MPNLKPINKSLRRLWQPKLRHSHLLGQNIGSGFMHSGGGAGLDAPVFIAPLLASLVSQSAFSYNAYTFTRASAATVRDHEGRVHVCEVNEARFEGARRVSNLVTVGDIGGFGTAGNPVELSPDEYHISGLGLQYTASWFQRSLAGINLPLNNRYLGSIYVKAAVAEDVGKTISLAHQRDGGGTYCGVTNKKITLTAEYTRYATPSWVNIDGANIGIRTYVFAAADDTATQCIVKGVMTEDVTGRANTESPSEYVSVGIATGAEEVPSTSFADWADPTMPDNWETWGTHNAFNYVEEGVAGGLRVVSDGTSMGITLPDTLIDGKVYIVEYEYSDRTASLCNVVMGTTNYALPASVGVRTELKLTSDGTALTIKRNLAACDVTFSYFSVKEVDHGANVDGVKYFDTENGNTVGGDFVVNEGVGAKLATVKGYLKEPQRTNKFTNSEDIAGYFGTQGATLTNNVYDSPYGGQRGAQLTTNGVGSSEGLNRWTHTGFTDRVSFSFEVIGDTFTTLSAGLFRTSDATWPAQTMRILRGPGTVDASVGGVPQLSNLSITEWTRVEITLDAAAITTDAFSPYIYPGRSYTAGAGSIGIDALLLEEGAFSTSYIPSTTGEKTRSRDNLSYEWNFNETAGTLVCTLNNKLDTADYIATGANNSMLSVHDGGYSSILYAHVSSGRYTTYDGVSAEAVLSNITADVDEKVAIRWGNGEKRLAYNGVLSPLDTYDGDWASTGTLSIMLGNNACGHIKDIKLYNKDIGDEKIQELTT